VPHQKGKRPIATKEKKRYAGDKGKIKERSLSKFKSPRGEERPDTTISTDGKRTPQKRTRAGASLGEKTGVRLSHGPSPYTTQRSTLLLRQAEGRGKDISTEHQKKPANIKKRSCRSTRQPKNRARRGKETSSGYLLKAELPGKRKSK